MQHKSNKFWILSSLARMMLMHESCQNEINYILVKITNKMPILMFFFVLIVATKK